MLGHSTQLPKRAVNTCLVCQCASPRPTLSTQGTPSLARPLQDLLNRSLVIKSRPHLLKSVILLLTTSIPKSHHINKKHSSMSANSLKGKLLLIKELHKRGPTDPKEIRRLLSGERLRLRQNTHCKPPLHRVNYLQEHPMDLLGNLHLVTHCGAGQEVVRNRGFSTGSLMRREEIVHPCDTSHIVTYVCLWAQCHRITHNHSLSEKNVTHLCIFRLRND